MRCCRRSISRSAGDDALAERDVAADQRIDGFGDHALDEAAHLGDQRVSSCRSLSNAFAVCQKP
jgi:hypothetical protein